MEQTANCVKKKVADKPNSRRGNTRKNPNTTFAEKLRGATTARLPLNRESRLSLRQGGSLKLRDLARAANYKRGLGQILDPEPWLFVAANYLSSFPADLKGFELSVTSLRLTMTKCGFDVNEIADEIERQVEWTKRWRASESKRLGRPHYIPIDADEAGKLLQITEEERRMSGASNIGWAGGSFEARQVARKLADRERKELTRRANGMKPRRPKQEPWVALRMSKAAFYRNGLHRETPVSAANKDTRRETEVSETEVSAANKDGETPVSAAIITRDREFRVTRESAVASPGPWTMTDADFLEAVAAGETSFI
jgi:hypothetical protein